MQLPRSITGCASAIASGELSPVALVEACLAQISRHDAQLKAWVIVDERGARAAAAALSDELSRGVNRGPLHGIPVGIKDIVDVRGFPTRAAAIVRQNQPPCERDATVVARLRDAGAIILGKTVTTEFASFDPPPTRNPWNLDRTPGGSSSGSAVAVAAGMCLAAIGSQTGGSITRPASFCGIASCKPTFGRVSRAGVLPLSAAVDHVGPLAHTVADLAIVLQSIAGYDESDAASAREPVPDYVAALADVRPPKLGVIEPYFMEQAEPRVIAVVRKAIEQLERAGAAVRTAPLPRGFDALHRMHRLVTSYEAGQVYRQLFTRRQKSFGREIAAFLAAGLATPIEQYQEARAHQETFRRDAAAAIGDYDALLTSATTSTAPGPETTGDPALNAPWSYCGLPTVSIPCGLADDGLPVAIQLIGRPFAEGPLLAAAAWCERQLRFAEIPPLVREPARPAVS